MLLLSLVPASVVVERRWQPAESVAAMPWMELVAALTYPLIGGAAALCWCASSHADPSRGWRGSRGVGWGAEPYPDGAVVMVNDPRLGHEPSMYMYHAGGEPPHRPRHSEGLLEAYYPAEEPDAAPFGPSRAASAAPLPSPQHPLEPMPPRPPSDSLASPAEGSSHASLYPSMYPSLPPDRLIDYDALTKRDSR